MTANGLLIAGVVEPVPGLVVYPPAGPPAFGPTWCTLDPGDYRERPTSWVRQIILHSTKGQWPQAIRPGSGPPGKAQIVADFWRGDPTHSAAHLVVDLDGSVACLCDLAYHEAYHAEGSNPWSIGIEMYQLNDGSLYEATLQATATLVEFLCGKFGIPLQHPRGPYRNRPLSRMEIMDHSDGIISRRQLGGPDLCGVFGHRDNTSNRGAGDPGDAIWRELAARGSEAIDFEAKEDILLGKERQAALNARGARLTVDGVCGPASWSAMRSLGFRRWRDVA